MAMNTQEHHLVSVHSFDVFDTCITRTRAHPRDLFFDLGWNLAPHNLDEKARARFASKFQRARIRAEKIANWRARPMREHADIFAIYANFHQLLHTDFSTEELVLAEVRLETESIYPIEDTVEKINAIRKSGSKIVFLSDMYIPGRLLEPILRQLGIMQAGDTLYVSCDVGAGKHSGKLFEHVLESEKVNSSQVIHKGDNLHADVRMARIHGLRTEHFTSAWLNHVELGIAGKKSPRPPGKSWLAAFSRRVRLDSLSTATQTPQVLDEIIHGIITPFLLAYVLWVLEDAKRRGIRRLYFVARDGEIFYRIAQELAPESIDIRYLYGSRRAWLAPSITPESSEWRRLLVVSGSASRPQDIAARIGLDALSQEKLRGCLGISSHAWESPLTLDGATRFIDELLSDPKAAALVAESAAEKRHVALAYFEQEGLFDETPWALVDAGWSLNSQSALKRILASSARPCQAPRGYYLGLAVDHLDTDQAGEAYAFTAPPGSLFSRRRVIVEHCFLPACHSSTKAYQSQGGGHISPVFSPEAREEAELAYARRLHNVATRAAKLAANQKVVRDCLKNYTPVIISTAANFIRHPSVGDACAMSKFGTTADLRQESGFVEPLCRSLTLRDVWVALAMTLSKQKTFKSPAYMWLEGSIALSPKIVQLPLKLMLWLDDLRNSPRRGR